MTRCNILQSVERAPCYPGCPSTTGTRGREHGSKRDACGLLRVERDEEDLVRLYLTDIGQYPLLTKDDEMQVYPVPTRLDFALQGSIARLIYGNLEMTNMRGGLRLKDGRLTLEDLRAEALGGEIRLESEFRRGSTFTIVLPLRSPPQEEPAPQPVAVRTAP